MVNRYDDIAAAFFNITADCDFDQGVCKGWSNAFNDDFNWSIGKGTTRSFFTGPHSDIYVLGKFLRKSFLRKSSLTQVILRKYSF